MEARIGSECVLFLCMSSYLRGRERGERGRERGEKERLADSRLLK